MTTDRTRDWQNLLRDLLGRGGPDPTLHEDRGSWGYTEGRSSNAGPNPQQIPRNAANNLGLGRGLNREWAQDALARGPRDPVRNFVEPMSLALDSYTFGDQSPTRRAIRRELQRVVVGIAAESISYSGLPTHEDVVLHALHNSGLGPLTLEWLASLDDVGVQVDRDIATYTYRLCFSSYHPDFGEVLNGGPRGEEILQQWSRDRYAGVGRATMREMQERMRSVRDRPPVTNAVTQAMAAEALMVAFAGSLSDSDRAVVEEFQASNATGSIRRSQFGFEVRDANGHVRVRLGALDSPINHTPEGVPIPIVTNEIPSSVHVQAPEVPASFERRLKLNHKLRGKNHVTHSVDQGCQNPVNKRIALRRARAKRPPRD